MTDPAPGGAKTDPEVETLRAAIGDLELDDKWNRRLDGRYLGQLAWMQGSAAKNRALHQGFRPLDKEATSHLFAKQVEHIAEREWETYLSTIVDERAPAKRGRSGS